MLGVVGTGMRLGCGARPAGCSGRGRFECTLCKARRQSQHEPTIVQQVDRSTPSMRSTWSSPSAMHCFAMPIVGPNLSDFGPNLVDSGNMLFEFGRSRARFGRFRAEFGCCRAECGRFRAKLVDSGNMLFEFGRFRARFGRFRAELGRFQAMLGRVRTNIGRLWAYLGPFGRIRARIGPSKAEFGRTCPNLGQFGPEIIKHRPGSVCCFVVVAIDSTTHPCSMSLPRGSICVDVHMD